MRRRPKRTPRTRTLMAVCAVLSLASTFCSNSVGGLDQVAPVVAIGGACNAAYECGTNFCENAVCVVSPNGEIPIDGVCENGGTCVATATCQQGICVPAASDCGAPGAGCLADADCCGGAYGGAYCSGGVCRSAFVGTGGAGTGGAGSGGEAPTCAQVGGACTPSFGCCFGGMCMAGTCCGTTGTSCSFGGCCNGCDTMDGFCN